MAATAALVRGQAPAAMTTRKGGRARKRITYKEVGVGALGAVAGGAGSALLVRFGVPPVWAGGGMAAAGGAGALMTKGNWRAFFAGTGAGGGAMLAAAAAGAFPGKKDADKKETKQIEGGSDATKNAPAAAKNANPTRNATVAQQMREQIARAMRDVRQPQPA